jgi:Amidohydrolase family
MTRRLIRYALLFILAIVILIAGLAFALRPPMPITARARGAVLRNVTVINPGLHRRSGQTVTVEASKITSITKASEAAGSFSEAYVLPGLIDMHVHHVPARAFADNRIFALMYLAHGVTTVRDTGYLFGSAILRLRDQIRTGEFPGPQIFTCGPIIDGDPPIRPGSKVVRNAAEGARAVDEVAATGVDCIKVYQNLTPDALAGIEEAAAHHHLPVIGHVPTRVPFEQAHLADVQHLIGVPLPALDQTLPEDLQLQLLASAWANIDQARIDFVVRTSVEQKLTHTDAGLLAAVCEPRRLPEGLAGSGSRAPAAILPRSVLA